MTTIVLTAEDKVNTIALTMESKQHGETWDDSNYSWDQATGTWDVPSVPLIEEDKVNTIALTLETK